MPVVAVPKYISEKNPHFYIDTPPGHRFYLYLPVWGIDEENGEIRWSIEDRVVKYSKNGDFKGWENLDNKGYACEISGGVVPDNSPQTPRQYALPNDQETRQRLSLKRWNGMMEAIVARQHALAATLGDRILTLQAKSTAPFATGLGNEHPLENGFAFLWPYGLPYLPGSGVKGVLRRVAQELAQGLWGDTRGWSDEKKYPLVGAPSGASETTLSGANQATPSDAIKAKKIPPLSMIDVLFGYEPGKGESNHVRGCLTFWDVHPKLHGDALRVEIMTPHQKHYYQDGQAPHDSGQPTIIKFLSIPPQSQFAFHVVCDTRRLEKLAPDLSGRWQDLLRAAFEHAFEWLGFGAKTAVGYGVMERDRAAEEETEKQARQQEKAARVASMSEEERQIEALRELFQQEKRNGTLTPQGRVAEQRVKLLKNALEWEDPKLRCQAGQLLQEIAKALKWPRRRERDAKAQVQDLLQSCP